MNTILDPNDIQALVFSGHGRLREALALGVTVIDRAPARIALAALLGQQVSFGLSRGERQHAVQVMLSAAGLAALTGGDAWAEGLEAPFREGIVTGQRSRALGDAGRNDPTGWGWRDATVHALFLIYAPTQTALDEERDRLLGQLPGWARSFELPVCLPADSREPFGFRDGISSVRIATGDAAAPPGTELVAPGEIVLGQQAADGTVTPPPALGENGSFVVVRQLEQDVEGFWQFWRSQAKSDEEAVWLAAKSVGRWPNGMPLGEGPPGPEPASDEAAVMRALSFDRDRLGRGCPFGAHIRRANPRDALDEDVARSRAIVGQHRILRRGRMYGSPAPRAWYPQLMDRPEPGQDVTTPTPNRGLLFMCLCTDIARQFEFIQQTWLNNPKFADLYDEADPIGAGEGMPQDSRRYSIPGQPLRRRLHGVRRWVTVRGGGYFLLPGRKALSRLLQD